MRIEENVSLKDHSTMRLGGNARYLVNVYSSADIEEAIDWAVKNNQCVLPIGSGSNIFWDDKGFNGLVMVMNIGGKELIDETTLRLGAGENWDSVVQFSVNEGLSGIETLSLIPGTVGATPVQNVGAYGSEISDCLVSLDAYDLKELRTVTITNTECNFGYRSSRFKTTDKGRFIITSITLKLSKLSKTPPFYDSLQRYLDENNITDYSPSSLRDAVIAIRSSKLPDPSGVANNGSFFANPIIESEKFEQLKIQFPSIIGWPTKDGQVKLAAAWLVEQCGFKGKHDESTGMATWGNQSLVLVNDSAENTADLLNFKDKIINAVQDKFGVELQQEPEFIQWED